MSERTLKVVEHDDANLWLAYECHGEPAQIDVDLIRGVYPQSNGQSLLHRGKDSTGQDKNNLCDSTSAEVLAALGWEASQ